MHLWVRLEGLQTPLLAIYDGGAEVPVISEQIYLQMSPPPKLRPSPTTIKGLYGPSHNPLGICTLKIEIPDLEVVVEYDVVVDRMDEVLLLDAGFMHHTGIVLDYGKKELRRGEHVVKPVEGESRGNNRVRRLAVQQTWTVPARSRQLVPGKVQGDVEPGSGRWLVEPSAQFMEKKGLLVARTLSDASQASRVIPAEVFNPSDEPVILYKDTTLGVISRVNEVQSDAVGDLSASAEETSPTSPQLPKELQKLVDEARPVLTPQQLDKFAALVDEYQDVFSTPEVPFGQTDVVYHDIKTVGEPIKCAYRRIPTGLRQEAVAEEDRMKDLDVIEPSDSPWAAPVVLVRKKDGTLRYCIDYRRLNDVTQKDSYPLPNMQDCLESLDGACFFSSMDLCSGYWQVKLTDEARDKTSFYGAGGGLWRFKVMPFGLCNAPATFERLMERVLGSLQWQICLCYLDDVLVFSRTVNKHLLDLRAVFDKFRDAKLRLKPKKCHFFQRQVTFLGHVVSEQGVHTDPAKVAKVRDCPRPVNKTEVRSVVGMFSYYRRFIPHFSETAKPLIELTAENRPFTWGEAQDKAFQEMKTALVQAPILAHPRHEGLFVLDTDASDDGIGAVLSQEQDGEERVISYGSRLLSSTERNYCITRRELLAVVHFAEQYKHFLLGRKFLVRTDNAAVRYWTRMHASNYDPHGQVARWMVRLGTFDFDIRHRTGKLHSNADSLSRMPFLQCVQCDIRHRGALRSKRGKPVLQDEDPEKDASETTSTDLKRDSGVDKSHRDVVLSDEKCTHVCAVNVLPSTLTNSALFVEGEKGDGSCCSESSICGPGREVPGTVLAVTRGQLPQGPQNKSDSWMAGGACISRSTLWEEQRKDTAVIDALCWLKDGSSKPPRESIMAAGLDAKFLWANFDALVIVDGILCRKLGPLRDGSVRTTAYAPQSLRKQIMKLCHDNKTGGHFYFWKSLKSVKRNFIWAGMSKDVQLYCRACDVCATRKNAGKRHKAAMRRYDMGYPMEEVSIDLMGPFPVSSQGNKYVLVVVDAFSKWMEAYAIPSIEASVVAEKLVLEFVSRFGVPLQIRSDRGRQFDCELFGEMCRLLEVGHYMSTSFHPQGNSKCERMVKVVGNLIASFCKTYTTWDEHLPLLTMAYRSTIHDVTGFSPNYVMLGREVSMPLEVMLGNLAGEERVSQVEYIKRLKERLHTCFSEVRDHMKRAGERQRKFYNLSADSKNYRAGDVVYLQEKTRKKGVSPKLMPKWRGPYLVISRFGTVCEVQTSAKTSKLCHFDLLKLCHSLNLPAWLIKTRRKLQSP